jgi:anti-sigma regulatory factor (Ser/Thr protein kinase)
MTNPEDGWAIEHRYELTLAEHNQEDKVWREYLQPHLADLPENVQRILGYGFTEMYNNAVEHSEGTRCAIRVGLSDSSVRVVLKDDGIGIFKKIQRRCGLDDQRQAILELSKGKLTTDPTRHSGQGIFFTSRMFDHFGLAAGELFFKHDVNGDDWLVDIPANPVDGTFVSMEISRDSTRLAKEVFDLYARPEEHDYGFSRTRVPLMLARYDNEELVSRSQAKRVLARCEKFKRVTLDFAKIESIGQAFADEVFRVFPNANPGVEIDVVNVYTDVRRMIARAEKQRREESGNV